ncbi:MAG: GxxExxY protein [Acidobacteria bacterium]|nr:MAG: GxxExxY protein [Acidobacteriota bacterium]
MHKDNNVLTGKIIGAGIEVHRSLGPGLLESAYQRCLARELEIQGITYKYEWPLPLEYKGVRIAGGYRMDLLVEGRVMVEVKAVSVLAPIHDAQLLTYMRLRRVGLGLLMNFNEVVLKDGIRRKILDVD